MFKKQAKRRVISAVFVVFVLAAATLGTVMLHAAASNTVQKGGLLYVPDHSVFFADVDTKFSWAVHPIDFLKNRRVVSGTSDLVYSPEKKLTRADFVSMLTRAYNMSDYVGGGSFADVPEKAYYSDAVSAAKNLGIISGDEYGNFNPVSPLTRQDAMVMLRRTLEKAGMRFAEGDLNSFTDAAETSAYAKADVAKLAKANVITGYAGKLSPKTSVTRAEMAVMLYRAMMLEPGDQGNPTFVSRSNVVNVCIGESFYANVTIAEAQPDQIFGGLYACVELSGEGEDYTATLGEIRSIDQKIVVEDGILKVDGEPVTVADTARAISIDPYGVISEGMVSTGDVYKNAAVSLVDGVVSAVYYTK